VTSSSDAILSKTLDGIVTSWNAAAERLFGYSEQEMIGQSTARLFPPGRAHEERLILAQIAAGKRVEPCETIRIDKNGELLGVSISASPVADGRGRVIGAADIVRSVSGKALLEREEWCRSIINTAADAIIVIDELGAIQTINPAGERMLGYSTSEVAGKNVSVIMPEPYCSAHDRYISAYLETGNAKIIGRGRELEHRRKDGSTFIAELAVTEWRASGKSYFTGIIRDVTERKRYEEQIRLLMSEVNHRAKNMLALVQAVARQTAAASPDDFIERFGERIQSLAASQDLLVRNEWKGAAVCDLFLSQLAPFKDLIGTRIKLRGPSLVISARAAQPISIALHELATNAGKYGALSNGNGSVDICWSTGRADTGEETFLISWREKGGPAVVEPSKQGFGSMVLSNIVTQSLDGEADLDFAEHGLTWRLSCLAKAVIDN
jgi:PAS domain S-box-containing protein